jgi:hypothetical protein
VTWKHWYSITVAGGGCGAKVQSSGVIKFPSTEEGWKYWETAT